MKGTKKIISAALAAILILSLATVAFATDSINVSVYSKNDGSSTAVSSKTNQTFSVYLGADALSLNEKPLNTYQFTVLYDPDYIEPVQNSGKNLTGNTGYSLFNGDSASKTIETKTYQAYTFSFTSYDKGFAANENAFKALASIDFKCLKTGSTTLLLLNEDVLLLPVDTEAASETLPSNVSNGSVDITIQSSSNGSGGNSGSVASRTVTFDADGIKTTQRVTLNGKATKPKDPVKEGYTFKGWYTDRALTTEFDFDTPIRSTITLYAKFEKNKVDDPNPPQPPIEDKMNFTDVKENDWFYEGVEYAWKNKLVSGTGNNEFSPNMPLTRGTLVTLLYRLEKEPAAPACTFTDVAAGSWYEKAIAWAADKQIVLGVGDGLFAPDTAITREQIATILYKYTGYKNGDVNMSGSLESFTDKDSVSDWADTAMKWALGKELIKGVGNNQLAPLNNATRAEIVTILMRYSKLS